MNLKDDRLLTVAECARWLRLTPHAIYQRLAAARKSGKATIPYTRVGRTVRFRVADVRAWLIAQSQGQLALELHPGDEVTPQGEDK